MPQLSFTAERREREAFFRKCETTRHERTAQKAAKKKKEADAAAQKAARVAAASQNGKPPNGDDKQKTIELVTKPPSQATKLEVVIRGKAPSPGSVIPDRTQSEPTESNGAAVGVSFFTPPLRSKSSHGKTDGSDDSDGGSDENASAGEGNSGGSDAEADPQRRSGSDTAASSGYSAEDRKSPSPPAGSDAAECPHCKLEFRSAQSLTGHFVNCRALKRAKELAAAPPVLSDEWETVGSKKSKKTAAAASKSSTPTLPVASNAAPASLLPQISSGRSATAAAAHPKPKANRAVGAAAPAAAAAVNTAASAVLDAIMAGMGMDVTEIEGSPPPPTAAQPNDEFLVEEYIPSDPAVELQLSNPSTPSKRSATSTPVRGSIQTAIAAPLSAILDAVSAVASPAAPHVARVLAAVAATPTTTAVAPLPPPKAAASVANANPAPATATANTTATTAAPPKAAAAPRKLMACLGAGCTKIGDRRCSRCRSVYYCSVSCQTAHWPTHSLACVEYAAVAQPVVASGTTPVANPATTSPANAAPTGTTSADTARVTAAVSSDAPAVPTARSEPASKSLPVATAPVSVVITVPAVAMNSSSNHPFREDTKHTSPPPTAPSTGNKSDTPQSDSSDLSNASFVSAASSPPRNPPEVKSAVSAPADWPVAPAAVATAPSSTSAQLQLTDDEWASGIQASMNHLFGAQSDPIRPVVVPAFNHSGTSALFSFGGTTASQSSPSALSASTGTTTTAVATELAVARIADLESLLRKNRQSFDSERALLRSHIAHLQKITMEHQKALASTQQSLQQLLSQTDQTNTIATLTDRLVAVQREKYAASQDRSAFSSQVSSMQAAMLQMQNSLRAGTGMLSSVSTPLRFG